MSDQTPDKPFWNKVGDALLSHPRWIAWAVAVVFAGVAYFRGGPAPVLPPVPDPAPLVVQAGDDPAADHVAAAQAAGRSVYSTGWVSDPDAVQAVAKTLRFPTFSATPAGQVREALPDHVYLWEAYRKLTGRNPPEKNQRDVGSCVSFGTNNAIERTMAADIAQHGARNEFKFICEEVTYAGSRVEVGGGRIRGDGSVGAWAAQFVQKWGVVSREKHGQYDLTTYDTGRCRQWGSRGVPDDLEPVTREHPVQDITQIKSWEDAKKALAQGYGIAVCSNQGFSMRRDARGVAAPQGNWGHCMCIDGYHAEAGREYGHIENSWGADAHTGPTGWGSPSTAGFWADSKTISRMIAAGDTWAFSSLKGFPSRKFDWFAQVVPAREPQKRPDLFAMFALAP